MNNETEVEAKVIDLEPVLRKTLDGTPVKLLEEIPVLPIEHCLLSVIVHPDTNKEFKGLVRGDALVPPWIPTRAATKRVSDIVYKLHIDTPEELAALEKARQDMALNDPDRFAKMEHARKHRETKEEYKGIPDEIVCSKCNTPKKVSKANILERSQKAKQTIEDWIKAFQCSDCKPLKRGRQTNPKWALLPKELKCHFEGCPVILVQHPSMTEKQSVAAGKSFNEFCDTWLCREHREKKPHHMSKEARVARGEVSKATKPVIVVTETSHRRGRVADPRWNGMAKELVCHYPGCKKVQVQHPSLTLKAAEHAGLSFEEFVQGWKCREHRKNA